MSPAPPSTARLQFGAGVGEEDVLVGGDAAVCYEFAGSCVASYRLPMPRARDFYRQEGAPRTNSVHPRENVVG